jgi:hypothetical protein
VPPANSGPFQAQRPPNSGLPPDLDRPAHEAGVVTGSVAATISAGSPAMAASSSATWSAMLLARRYPAAVASGTRCK